MATRKREKVWRKQLVALKVGVMGFGAITADDERFSPSPFVKRISSMPLPIIERCAI
jgi:hypothetical protein